MNVPSLVWCVVGSGSISWFVVGVKRALFAWLPCLVRFLGRLGGLLDSFFGWWEWRHCESECSGLNPNEV